MSPPKPPFFRNPGSYANIPDELKLLLQWVLWKFVLKENGTWTKVPYSPHSSVNFIKARVNDPTTWGSFEQVEKKMRESDEYDGIGFVFTEDDPYVGIDLDNKKNDPEIAQEISQIASMFASYRERSPSGLGFHIIAKGTIPSSFNAGMVEMYDKGHYFTMTGDAV